MATEAFHLAKHQIAFMAFGGWDFAGAKAFGYPTYWVNRLNEPPKNSVCLPMEPVMIYGLCRDS